MNNVVGINFNFCSASTDDSHQAIDRVPTQGHKKLHPRFVDQFLDQNTIRFNCRRMSFDSRPQIMKSFYDILTRRATMLRVHHGVTFGLMKDSHLIVST